MPITITTPFRIAYATLDPARLGDNVSLSASLLSETIPSGLNDWETAGSTIPLDGIGKWYWEVTVDSGTPPGGSNMIGVVRADRVDYGPTMYPGLTPATDEGGYFDSSGDKFQNGLPTSYGNSYVVGDIVSVAFELYGGSKLGRIWWGVNGTWQASGDPATASNPALSGMVFPTGTTDGWLPAGGIFSTEFDSNTGAQTYNFGVTPFTHTVPTGFAAGVFTLG